MIENYIFQGTGDMMVPLVDVKRLQGNLDFKGGDKFS